jgi:outer membrane receptor for monomeric catechols
LSAYTTSSLNPHSGLGVSITLFVSLLLASVPAVAQDFSITGTVRDADAVVPGANVTLRGPSSNTRTATTDASGQYSFSAVTAGRYELTFERAGFAPRTEITFLGAK